MTRIAGNEKLKGYLHPFGSNECVRVVKLTITMGVDSGKFDEKPPHKKESF